MTPFVAVSTTVAVSLAAGVALALGFVTAVIWLRLRGRPRRELDIPAGMRPGPADEVLERRLIERFVGWNLVFVVVIAIALAGVFYTEPETNAADFADLTERSVERGSQWFALTTEENPTGFACARCHGEDAQGGTTPFVDPETEETVEYPVPSLVDVCGRLTLDQIQETIEQGREGTPMPSWSVKFEGPMNDQQITDLINYLLTIQTVEGEDNQCLNPPTETS